MASEEHSEQPIIIKKIIKGGHGHHGGAWKVAYADFVTAMMAFFIVMWIISASEETKESVQAYFQDPGAFNFINGKMTVPIDLGRKYSPDSKQGENVGEGTGKSYVKENDDAVDEYYQAVKALKEQAVADSVKSAQRVKAAGEGIREYLQELAKKSKELEKAVESVEISMSDEGLRIELIESNDNLFFMVGSSELRKEAKDILGILAYEIGKLPNFIQMEGHTDARGMGSRASYTNWELSSDRANAARRVLAQNGVWDGQINKVSGFADTFLKNPSNPFDNTNRRISILIKNQESADFIPKDELKTQDSVGTK